jgi:hypothetical protein
LGKVVCWSLNEWVEESKGLTFLVLKHLNCIEFKDS